MRLEQQQIQPWLNVNDKYLMPLVSPQLFCSPVEIQELKKATYSDEWTPLNFDLLL